MTNAQRAELKMWVRRLESAKKAIKELLPKDQPNAFIACENIDTAVIHLEAIK